jgi:hypothetical protein
MRVRISFDALRLCLLVAAGVTSGYLWRAAFESSSPAEQHVAATQRVAEPTPAPPVVRIQPRHLTVPHKGSVSRHVVPGVVVQRAPRLSTSLASRPAGTTPPPAAGPETQPQKPTPAPPPQPTTTTAPPPTQAPATPVAAPAQEVASPPPTTTTQPSETPSSDGSKPGWGNGDKNHDHSGPGGKGK